MTWRRKRKTRRPPKNAIHARWFYETHSFGLGNYPPDHTSFHGWSRPPDRRNRGPVLCFFGVSLIHLLHQSHTTEGWYITNDFCASDIWVRRSAMNRVGKEVEAAGKTT